MLTNILTQDSFSEFHSILEKQVFGFSLNGVDFQLGTPIKCQLSKSLIDSKEIENHLKQKRDSKLFIYEKKYDGERTQIHFNRQESMISSFSRSNEPQTKKFDTLLSHLYNEIMVFIRLK